MINYIVFFTIVGLIWYWWNSISAYEVAYKEAKAACRRLELQFLDDTLDVIKFRLCRHSRGHMQICRIYEFEFSSDGDSRYKGYVRLSGLKYESIDMDAYKIVSE
ncbi:MAG: DUF3301 domain-containing protein [gamma proteobacterium symbiont of Bathyaustriella thionipta]|nr:DUF3301 domain-containing protein [gamma proteobacterium symbiont of Bathyaustriella thionipta]MCU7950100.1 DUF3301 domain-containing protein [gamma proteobacterium symbiont of Bathyaustriella thionipta]MCU7953485.1 DUF3301 domain-containing protein [gamma proteobacterium symbiont of Bathyaustriella thionipta]MCU7955566.1 DUF3301 domain-containing protein [gamma proteobacterium symbiont of Bathyaustriella thionipta]MCU7967634.1 DUF3301 domain-containing protein [gamma proteobacterium symbion